MNARTDSCWRSCSRRKAIFSRPPGAARKRSACVARHPPDLVLLDVMMPGMDGCEVTAAIKGSRATQSIPIILVTALDDRNARMRGLDAGAEDFLTKPVDRAELCVRVRNLLRLKAQGDFHDKYGQMLEGEVDSRTADLHRERTSLPVDVRRGANRDRARGAGRTMAAGQSAPVRAAGVLARGVADVNRSRTAADGGNAPARPIRSVRWRPEHWTAT